MIPLVLLIVVTQMVVSAFAKTYREAQTYLGLLQLLPVIPSVLLSLMPISPQLWMYAIPLIGQQLIMMGLLRGELIAAHFIILTTVMTLVALIIVFLSARTNLRIGAAGRQCLGACQIPWFWNEQNPGPRRPWRGF